MGLLTVIRKAKQKEKEMRLLMVGLDNAGKTTIVKRMNGEDTSTISPTLGFNIKTMQYNEYRLNIWDVGGQKTLRSYWRNYFEATDGLIWVVDSADRHDAYPQFYSTRYRLGDCAAELGALLKEEKLSGASLLVLANKQDLPGALSLQEIELAMELPAMKGRHTRIVACSAATGEGLLTAFDWLVADISSRVFLLHE